MTSDRFARQRVLAEVGDRGQKRFAEACVRLPDGPGVDVAAEYLRRAGFGAVSIVADASLPPSRSFSSPHAELFRHSASLAVAEGAWRALDRIRAELGLDVAPTALPRS